MGSKSYWLFFNWFCIRAEVVLCLWNWSNGKSTLFEIIMHILSDYSKTADFETFLSKQKSGVRELEAVGELKGYKVCPSIRN